MKTITEEQAIINPTLEEVVGSNSKLKDLVVDYVGNSVAGLYKGDELAVTVQDVVEVFSREFPEFLMVVAEENWIRGYHQALEDVDAGRHAELEETQTDDLGQ
jgi:hypothetical protein